MDCTNEIATSHYHVFWWTTACSLGNIYSPALLFSIANRNRTVCVHIYTVYIHDISDRSACQASIPSWCPTHNQNTILSMYKMYATRSTFSFYFLLLSITSCSLLSLSLSLHAPRSLSVSPPAQRGKVSERWIRHPARGQHQPCRRFEVICARAQTQHSRLLHGSAKQQESITKTSFDRQCLTISR